MTYTVYRIMNYLKSGIKFEILKITNDNLVSSKLLIIEKEARSSTL